MPRKLTYLVGVTLDGFIAGPGGEIDFFPIEADLIQLLAAEYPETLPTPAREAMGIVARNRRFDCVVQGRATYAQGLEQGVSSPFAHLDQYVVSTSMDMSPDSAVSLIRSDLIGAVAQMKAEDGLGIWLCGGGDIAGQLWEEIDELIVKTYPVIIGDGIAMFAKRASPQQLELIGSQTLPSGVVVSRYKPIDP